MADHQNHGTATPEPPVAAAAGHRPGMIGVRRARSGALAFCATGSVELEWGDPVLIARGDNVGLGVVVLPPPRIVSAPADLPARLQAEALADPERIRAARAALDAAAAATAATWLRDRGSPLRVVGAGWAVDGSRLTLALAGAPTDPADLAGALSAHFGVPVRLVRLDSDGSEPAADRSATGSIAADEPPDRPDVPACAARAGHRSAAPLDPATRAWWQARREGRSDAYTRARRRLPYLGQRVQTPHGPGFAAALEVEAGVVVVELEGGGAVRVGADDWQPLPSGHAERG